VLERKYNSACFILSEEKRVNEKNNYDELAPDLSATKFLKQLVNYVKGNIN